MCLGGGSKPAPQEAPAPPPPAPDNVPAPPAFNEDMTNAANADAAVKGARRGRKALRVDLNTGSKPATSVPQTGGQASASGLAIPL